MLTLILLSATLAWPQNQKKLAAKPEEAKKASDVFTEIMNVPEKGVLQGLLDKAEAIAVFPGVIKGGFIIGACGGHGLVSRRVPGGWVPRHFSILAAAVLAC